jgi:alkanesulfonate monooxygenase SsuD/methylene tetrahydromethanopterin reductase-like flavin-dependent oxidoreductase (luciferase family)
MKIWLVNEQSYFPAWKAISGNLRVTPPTSVMNRDVVSDLLNRYLDEWLLGDELGFDIMVNEHHSSMTCMSSSASLTLAALARQTRSARLLCLGVPMANRTDPLRVAEELAILDNLSRGRLEFGLVKGSAWELYSSNQNPARMMERYWEAHDLILRAFATRDGPFSWHGKHFHYRSVNLIPPIYQQPHPPMWLPGSGPDSAKTAARLKYVLASFLNGYVTAKAFKMYREEYKKLHGQACPPDRLAYLGMAAVGNNEAEARQRAQDLYAYYATVTRSPAATINPPGYLPPETNAQMMVASAEGANKHFPTLPDGTPIPPDASLEVLAEAGIVFWGTPDMVTRQIQRFARNVGGFTNFLCMAQGGYLNHQDTVNSLTLLAREVYPQLRHLETQAVAAG